MTKKKRRKRAPRAANKPDGRSDGTPTVSWIPHLIAVITVAILVFAAYSNTFNSSFQFDDIPRIKLNPAMRSLGSLSKNHPFFAGKRSVVYSSLWMNYRLGGLSVAGYHTVNLLIHIASSVLVYFLVLSMLSSNGLSHGRDRRDHPLRSNLLAGGTALLFAVHPIQTQSVTYIIQRAELLAGFFQLAAMLLYISARRSRTGGRRIGLYAGAAISYVLALESKEQAAVLPVVLVLLDFLVLSGAKWSRFKKAAGRIFVPLAAMLLITGLFLGRLEETYKEDTAAGYNIEGISKGHYALTNIRVVFVYLRLLVFPVNQNLDYDFPISRSFVDPPSTLVSFIILLGIASAAVLLARRHPLYSFCVFYFFVTLAPSSSFVPIVDVIFEHRLYMPCLGVFLVIGLLIGDLYRRFGFADVRWRRTVLGAVCAVVILACVTATFRRNLVWRTPETLWADVVSKSPKKSRPRLNMADAWFQQYVDLKRDNPDAVDRGEDLLSKAVEELKKAIELSREEGIVYNEVTAHTDLGRVYLELGKHDKAIGELHEAIGRDPKNPDRYRTLAETHLKLNRYNESVEYFEKLSFEDPGIWAIIRKDVGLRRLIGEAFKGIGIELETNDQGERYGAGFAAEEAIALYERWLRLFPSAEAYYSIAVVYDRTGRPREAVENYRRVLESDARFPYADVVRQRIGKLESIIR